MHTNTNCEDYFFLRKSLFNESVLKISDTITNQAQIRNGEFNKYAFKAKNLPRYIKRIFNLK